MYLCSENKSDDLNLTERLLCIIKNLHSYLLIKVIHVQAHTFMILKALYYSVFCCCQREEGFSSTRIINNLHFAFDFLNSRSSSLVTYIYFEVESLAPRLLNCFHAQLSEA